MNIHRIDKPKPLIALGALPLFAALLIGMLVASQSWGATPLYAETSTDADPTNINALIQKLDGPTYRERELAMQKLTELGEPALKPMAIHYLASSPESSWRIRNSLEAIATSGNESTFLKSVAILQLLVGTDNQQLQSQLVRLKFEWATKQTENAVAELERAGATIENYIPAQGQQAVERWMRTQNSEAFQIKFKPPARLSRNQQLKLIDKIVNGSQKENRKLVLGSSEIEAPKSNQDPFDNLERQIGNRFIVRNGVVLRVDSSEGVVARIGDAWTGNRGQFRLLESVDGLTEIAFAGKKLESFHLETLQQVVDIDTLEFEDCDLTSRAFATVGLPETITTLRFKNQNIDVATIDRISKLKLRSVVFDGCDFSQASYRKIFTLDSVSQMELGNMKVDSAAFSRLEKMGTLRSLKFSICRFKFSDYKQLTTKRPEIFVDFATNAFLGVRSVPGTNDACEISEVVADSGAERGGIEAGDIIVEVDGHAIQHFNDLRAHISLHEDGEKLDVVVLREDERVKLLVTLGNFADAPDQ